jgi:NAD(P)-dependent dehydrogenase (short-subunit alcohol dehydrogenase family)
MFDFSDRVVIVTGAVGDLGQAVTRAFQAAGARLALTDHAADRLQQVYSDIAGSRDCFLAGSVDVTDAGAVAAMVEETIGRFERIDVLVNTVGGFRGGMLLHETPLETWDLMFNLNARSVFIASRVVIPHMLRQGSGKIINVAARAGWQGSAKMAAYSASKSAVIRMTESMAAELKGSGINVNCVLPGTIDTPQNRQAMPKADYTRWIKPETLADAILFLASDAARDVHGAALPVFGRS